ncbi:hypothetical protein [Hydrogenophaga palleronii]|uniref:hypothetical protein n=1 Tax=Hydrogenophaga palleronii TaxID=65655 RepID=UPI00082592E1|nr:hypothetical protein [Hydrogenophaga palleronii]
MSEEGLRTSSDLIRWLKMLALPGWAKLGLAAIMLLTLANALGLLVSGMLARDKEAIAAAVSILTVGLPLGLIVIALVFGDGGSRKLRQLTSLLLEKEVPKALQENLAPLAGPGALANARIEHQSRGFITDYTVSMPSDAPPPATLHFRLELNVRKVNLVFWAPTPPADNNARAVFENHPGLHSCLVGAEREGYVLNPLIQTEAGTGRKGCVFIKVLHEDFLLSPAHRLYFAQDLSFFVRGLLEAASPHG